MSSQERAALHLALADIRKMRDAAHAQNNEAVEMAYVSALKVLEHHFPWEVRPLT